MPDKHSNKERIKEITAGIEKGIQELFESDRYRNYLTTMSRFHRYSLNNVMLIHAQKPDATLVAGFNKWKNSFGRHVKKGEKGIQILAPTPYKIKVDKEKLDPDTKLPMLDDEGKPITEEKEVTIPMFKVVSVFDVAQTEGKPLPQISFSLTGDVAQYEVLIEALLRTSHVPITIEPMEPGMDGYFSLTKQAIFLREGMSQVQTVCAAIHEMAHSRLHNYEKMTELADDGETILVPGEKSRNTEEVEAESISYAVCQYFGIETADNSFGYIATWSQGKELKELRASLETINKTSSELITGIEKHYREICKERGISMEAQEQPEAAPPADAEKLYLVSDSTYLHIQRTEDGFDYTLYDKTSSQLIDGGQLDTTDLNIRAACLSVCELHGLDNGKIAETSLNLLESLQEAQNVKPEQLPPPDPTISPSMMERYGYHDSNMFPLSKDRAMELLERDALVFMLNQDNTDEMVFDSEDIVNHDGIFGITHEEWQNIHDSVPARDVHRRFLDASGDAYAVMQLKPDAPAEIRFMGLKSLPQPPLPDNYDTVYTGPIACAQNQAATLENLFEIFNLNRPGDFTGHSLSVSDIIALKQDGVVSYHYCDNVGFQELTGFMSENYLKAAEMSTEDDYGMIDGIINNGQKPTVSDLEQQVKNGQSISLMDLVGAIQQEKKPSVLKKLKEQPPQSASERKPRKTIEKEI